MTAAAVWTVEGYRWALALGFLFGATLTTAVAITVGVRRRDRENWERECLDALAHLYDQDAQR